jgi:tRNA (adenine57-N1/adenine58-N1)-methyltransferase
MRQSFDDATRHSERIPAHSNRPRPITTINPWYQTTMAMMDEQVENRASTPATSPFFHTPPTAEAHSLAILHIKRDSLLPIVLQTTADDGYAEGAVVNTRYGSYPHSTLIGVPWGSQVRASNVDTGSRGRKGKLAKPDISTPAQSTRSKDTAKQDHQDQDQDQDASNEDPKKRKADDQPDDADASSPNKKTKSASAPLTEVTTAQDEPNEDSKKRRAEDQPDDATSLNKKTKSAPDLLTEAPLIQDVPTPYASTPDVPTQGVSTPDVPTQAPSAKASQPTHKVAVEAGSGFMHILQPTPESWTYSLDHRTQVVYTPDYSYVLQRMNVKPGDTLIEAGAGSGSFTHAAARAIFNGYPADPSNTNSTGKVCSFEYHLPRVQVLRDEITSHGLNHVVHINHRDVYNEGFLLPNAVSPRATAIFLDLPMPWLALPHLTREDPNSPLDPTSPVQICTFSPCIEQVTATASALRKAGWTEIQTVEVANRRLDVRRERVGLHEEGLRGVNSSAATVEESLNRLREVDAKLNDFHTADGKAKIQSKAERLAEIKRNLSSRKLFKEGRLVHRTEPEVKTHTSYLTFATLPTAWDEGREAAAALQWPVDLAAPGGKVKAN